MTWTTPTSRATGFLVDVVTWNEEHVDDLNHLRIGYGKKLSNVTTSGTVFSAGSDLLASPLSFVADGTSDYLVRVDAVAISNNGPTTTQYLHANLDGIDAGIIGTLGITTANLEIPCSCSGLLPAPSAGTHTLNVRVRCNGGTVTVEGGSGGPATQMPIVVELRGA